MFRVNSTEGFRMSRTFKDAPYSVKAQRYGNPETGHSRHCTDPHSSTSSFSAVFYAHEVAEREQLIAALEDRGYSVTTSEQSGFIASRLTDSDDHRAISSLLPRFMRTAANLQQVTAAARIITQHPQEISRWPVVESDVAGHRRLTTEQAYKHPKRNLFVEVTATRTTEHESRCWHGEYSIPRGGKFSGPSCSCSWCGNLSREDARAKIAETEIRAGRDEHEEGSS